VAHLKEKKWRKKLNQSGNETGKYNKKIILKFEQHLTIMLLPRFIKDQFAVPGLSGGLCIL
jgi:hypothetical protein